MGHIQYTMSVCEILRKEIPLPNKIGTLPFSNCSFFLQAVANSSNAYHFAIHIHLNFFHMLFINPSLVGVFLSVE